MNAISLLIGLLLGAALGAALGYLLARGRLSVLIADLTGRATAAEERSRAAQERAEIMECSAREKAALIDGQLAARFEAVSAQALDRSTRTLIEMAEGRLSAANARAAGELDSRRAAVEQMVQPLRDTLARVESQLRETETARQSSYAALSEQVAIARQSSEQLRAQTQALVTALRRPEARGRWGEMQLRRVVELAGMSSKCALARPMACSALTWWSGWQAARTSWWTQRSRSRPTWKPRRPPTRASALIGSLRTRVTCGSTWTGSLPRRTGPLSAPRPSLSCCSFPARRS